jgi:ABC-type glutathione transport system ATPase component
VENLSKSFVGARASRIQAVNNVSLAVSAGEIFGLLGESGCGKTTLARLILKLISPDSGKIYFQGEDIFSFDRSQTKKFRQQAQIVFQNPYASLNPRIKIGPAIAEPFLIHQRGGHQEAFKKATELLISVGLSEKDFFKYPHQFSAGARQRIALARALILNPGFLVLDEPVSSLDVTVQKQVLELLLELKNKFNLTYLFISHDIRIISNIATSVAVMKEGCLIESGPVEQVLKNPTAEYTRALLEVSDVPATL